MNDDIVTDLKQFITTTISQQSVELKADIKADIHALETRLETKIDDLTQFVTDTITTSNDTVDTQIKDHEKRLTRLEQNIA